MSNYILNLSILTTCALPQTAFSSHLDYWNHFLIDLFPSSLSPEFILKSTVRALLSNHKLDHLVPCSWPVNSFPISLEENQTLYNSLHGSTCASYTLHPVWFYCLQVLTLCFLTLLFPKNPSNFDPRFMLFILLGYPSSQGKLMTQNLTLPWFLLKFHIIIVFLLLTSLYKISWEKVLPPPTLLEHSHPYQTLFCHGNNPYLKLHMYVFNLFFVSHYQM